MNIMTDKNIVKKSARILALLLICLMIIGYGPALADDKTQSGRMMLGADPVSPSSARTHLGNRTVYTLYNPAVQTPGAIKAMARGLKNDADLIYAYVHDVIRYEIGYGVKKGALGTLQDRSGNAFDQSLLLAALLSESGYTVKFMHGTIRLTGAQASNWLGIADNVDAVRVLLGAAGIPAETSPASGDVALSYVDLDHVWVIAAIDGADYAFDPAFKTHQYTSGIDLSAAMGYSRANLLTQAGGTIHLAPDNDAFDYSHVQNISAQNLRAALNSYTGALVQTIKNAHPTKDITGIVGGSTIDRTTQQVRQSSLPYEQPGGTMWTSGIPDQYHTIIRISNSGVNQAFRSSDVYGRRLTIFPSGGNQQLMLDGVLVSSGAEDGELYLEVDHPYAAADSFGIAGRYGDQLCRITRLLNSKIHLLLGFGGSGRGLIEDHATRLEELKVSGAASDSEAVAGETLGLIGYNYTAQLSAMEQLAGRVTGAIIIRHHTAGVIAKQSDAQGNPSVVMDIPMTRISHVSKTSDQSGNKSSFLASAGRASALESGVMTQTTGASSASAIKALEAAGSGGVKIVEARTNNWPTIETDISAVSTDLADMLSPIVNQDSPRKVVIPLTAQTSVNNWSGVSFLIFNDDYTLARHLINSRKGSVTNYLTALFEYILSCNSTDCKCSDSKTTTKEPIDLSDGTFFHYFDDLSVGGNALQGLEFKRSYYSKSRLQDSGLGYGWGHNHSASISEITDGFSGLGEYSPTAAAAAITAMVAAHDILQSGHTLDKVMIATLIHSWLMDQLTENMVQVAFPGGSKRLIRYPDGTYGSDSCCDSETLTKQTGGGFTLTTTAGDAYVFEADGKLASKTDANGNMVSYGYDGNGKLTSVSNSFGRSLSLIWDGERISSVSSGGRSFSYGYDVNGRMTSSTDAAGNTTTFSYDDKNRMLTIVNPLDTATPYVANTYDELSRIATQGIAGRTPFTYYFGGFRSEELNSAGASSVYDFGTDLRYGKPKKVVKITDKTGRTITYEYDGRMRPAKVALPEGNALEYTYDGNNKPLTVTGIPKGGGAGLTTTYTYEASFHKVETVTDPLGRTATFGYDANGNLTLVQQPQAGGVTPTTTFTYNSQGLPLTITDPSGVVTQYGYNAAGDVTSITVDPGGKNLTTSFGYNSHGDLTSVTDPRGSTTSFTYDDMRRMSQSTAPSPFNYITTFGYDADSNLASVSRQGPPVQTASATWSITGKKLTETSPQGYTTQYQYDGLDRLWKIIDPENRTTQYAYDAAGRMVQVVNGKGNSEASFTYTDNGLVETVKDANNNQTTYTYDAYDRLIRTTFPNSSYEHLTLDAAGRATAVQMRDGRTVSYTLDALDRVTNRTVPGSSSDSYTYDAAGRVIDTIKSGYGTLHHGYDSAGRLTSVTWPGSKQMVYYYDAASNVTRMIYPDYSNVVYEYDELDRMTVVKYDPNSPDAAPPASTVATYAYDALSRRSSLTYANGASTSYSYSLNDNPTGLTFQAGGASSNLTYGYDMTGLRTSMTVDDSRFQPQFLLSGQRGLNANNLNQYTSITGKALAYDGNGNLSSDGTYTYVHDALNRLASATKQSAANTYQYGPLDRRTAKETAGLTTSYIYDGDQAAVEYDNSGALSRKFIYGPSIDQPLVMVRRGDGLGVEIKYYYHADVLGSIAGLTNEGGSWQETYSYSAWGKLNGSSSVGNPYFYTGRRYDTETGLYYYRARYYDAYLRRFIQPDPIGFDGGMNWYAYVSNSPVNYVDPWGLRGFAAPNSDMMNKLQVGMRRPLEVNEVHEIASWLGIVPAFGAVPDGLNGCFYLFRGEWSEASLSFAAAIPGIGDVFVGVDKVSDSVRALSKISKWTPKPVKAFDKAGIKYTEHFAARISGRAARGVNPQKALDAYNKGRLYYNPATKNYIRHSSKTGVSVVVDIPSGGTAITVFEGKASSHWVPVKWRP